MNNRYIFLFAWLLTIFLTSPVLATELTTFRILPNDSPGKIECDYLTIKDTQAQCITGGFLVSYALSEIQTIEVTTKGKLYRFKPGTEAISKRINELNADKKNRTEDAAPTKSMAGMHSFSFTSVSDFIVSLQDKFNSLIHGGAFSTILLIAGLILFLVGNVQFLIATFRAGILWGLSCIFLPFISFLFLLVHWETAAKPFFTILLGIALSFSATLLTPGSTRVTSSITYTQKINPIRTGKFQCSGKVYCSEMSSCAEAEFYLRNCPGTKMDGDNDGRPCEDQLCGH